MSTGATTTAERIALANPQWLLGLMLIALHVALASGTGGDWWSRAFLLAHFGLVLLWQPVWRGQREVEPRQALVVLLVASFLLGWFSWWFIALWVAVLFGVIGGMVPRIEERRQRLISVLAAIYLLSMLLIWIVPQLFVGQSIDDIHKILVRYGLPVVPLAILMVRVHGRPPTPIGVDLIYSVILFLLVVALVLGSFVVREVSQGQYVFALAQTLIVIAVLLVGLSWLWAPRAGFVGVGYLLSSYLMTLGLPFERWVQRLSELAQEEHDPHRFLTQAVQHMLDMPWVRGVAWTVPNAQGEHGLRTGYATRVEFAELRLVIYTRWEASPAILLHLNLLARVVGHFHDAKRREHLQRQSTYTYAVYETGARLTHDVKNLLQSMKSLCAAAASSTPDQAVALQALMQRQLPQIAQRLNTTLDKLRAPQPADTRLTKAADWWGALLARYSGREIEFVLDGAFAESDVPPELFDAVADNLIENALNKPAERRVKVRVTYSSVDGGTLSVCDDGAAIPQGLAAQLFEAPVPSRTGFGIGLYQSSKLAAQFGYRLTLAANRTGAVCFALAADPALAPREPVKQVA